jgi:hypothetical protein
MIFLTCRNTEKIIAERILYGPMGVFKNLWPVPVLHGDIKRIYTN